MTLTKAWRNLPLNWHSTVTYNWTLPVMKPWELYTLPDLSTEDCVHCLTWALRTVLTTNLEPWWMCSLPDLSPEDCAAECLNWVLGKLWLETQWLFSNSALCHEDCAHCLTWALWIMLYVWLGKFHIGLCSLPTMSPEDCSHCLACLAWH